MTDIMRRLDAANPVQRGERPDIESVWRKLDQADGSAQHQGSVPRSRRRQLAMLGAVAAGCVVPIVIAVGALALLSHHHTVGPASPAAPAVPTRAELQYVQKANEQALATPACRATRRRLTTPEAFGPTFVGPPLTDNGSPGHSFVSILGVLRRPARPDDSLPRSLRHGPGVRGNSTRSIFNRRYGGQR